MTKNVTILKQSKLQRNNGYARHKIVEMRKVLLWADGTPLGAGRPTKQKLF